MADRLFHPGDPCPICDDGVMEIERHLSSCTCHPLGDPCQSCKDIISELLFEGVDPEAAVTGPRPWIICGECDWMEYDGGISNHARIAAHARAKERAVLDDLDRTMHATRPMPAELIERVRVLTAGIEVDFGRADRRRCGHG